MGAVEGQQVATVEKCVLLQHLAPLGLSEHRFKRRAQIPRIDWIENRAKLGITRHLIHSVERVQVIVDDRIAPLLIERQQRRTLQAEYGQARHQRIGQRDGRRTGARIRDTGEALANRRKQAGSR